MASSLSFSQERALGRQVQQGLRAERMLSDHPESATPELHEQVRQGKAAQAALVEANMGLATFWARKLQAQYALPLEELRAAALGGLWQGVLHFDPERPTRLSTMAGAWIRRDVARFAQTAEPIRRSEQAQLGYARARRQAAALTQRLGRTPTSTELQAELGSAAADLAARPKVTLSLDAPIGTETGRGSWAERLADPSESPEELALQAAAQAELAQAVRAALGSLTPQQQRFARLRWGLDGGEAATHRACARALHCGLRQVAALEQECLSALRSQLVAFAS